MSPRRRIIILLILPVMLLGVLLALHFWPSSEPSYNGKTLSEWVHEYEAYHQVPGAPQRQIAVDAIRHIGTNAIPFLLAWIQYEEPAWVSELPEALQSHSMDNDGIAAFYAAQRVFDILGPQAKSAIPELSDIVTNSTDPNIVVGAAVAMTSIGPDALPAYLDAITNQQGRLRQELVFWMWRFGNDAEPALRTFVDVPLVSHEARRALWQLERAEVETSGPR